MSKTKNRVLVIGDIHEPYCKPGYFKFCCDLKKEFRCNKTVFIGDIVDLHAISYHERHPESDGPVVEMTKARKAVKRWYQAFPNSVVVVGNHDRRLIRKAASASIPEIALKTFKEVWDTPAWSWVQEFSLDGVRYLHGDGAGGGLYPAYNVMRKLAQSVVMGHHHTAAGVKYLCNPERRLFGLDVGCGIDNKAIQFLYADRNPMKPVIAAATIIDGLPQSHICPCGRGEKYHDSKFRKSR